MGRGMERVRWGILGPGTIARTFAAALPHSETGQLVAIGTRDAGRPDLARHFPGARVHEGYAALIEDPQVEAVYIATPHPFHAEWAIRALEAGKHVLVEKPMGLSAWEAEAIIRVARGTSLFLGEAFMYRLHPMTAMLVELVTAEAVGAVRMIQSSFGFQMPRVDPAHRLYANELAGGGILDVGGYPVSMARLIAGAVEGAPFLEPETVRGTAHIGATGVDEWAAATLAFPNGIIAETTCAISLSLDNRLRVFGSAGRIEVSDFWFASGHQGGTGRIEVYGPTGARRKLAVRERRWLYGFEIDAAGWAIREGRQEFDPPGMTWADTLGNMAVLDTWREQAGLHFVIEEAEARRHTISGRPLQAPLSARPGSIPCRPIRGLGKTASVLALGLPELPDFASAAILLDAFFEQGGTILDAGAPDEGEGAHWIGEWLATRDVRARMILLGRGVPGPMPYPEQIEHALATTLERLGTDYVDLYLLGGDNPDVPPGEFVDALDAEVAAGRLRGAYGFDGWSRERLSLALDHAAQAGRIAPTILGADVSLAVGSEEARSVCAAGTAAWRDWLAGRDMTVFAGAAAAQRFFVTERSEREDEDEAFTRYWSSEENFARRARAEVAAEQLGLDMRGVALAWALHQPFPVVAIIRPGRLEELDAKLAILKVALDPETVRWLETGRRIPKPPIG